MENLHKENLRPAAAQGRPGGSENQSTNAFEIGIKKSPPKDAKHLSLRHRSIFTPKRVNSFPGLKTAIAPGIRRMISGAGFGNKTASPVSMATPQLDGSQSDVQLEHYRELDFRQVEFFNFLDLELEKVEIFYKEKEEEATERLKVLREQLHIMRDRRLDELMMSRTQKMAKHKNGLEETNSSPTRDSSDSSSEVQRKKAEANGNSWRKPLDNTFDQIYNGRFGGGTKAMGLLGTPPGPRPNYDQRDYARRPARPEIPYRSAKRKLKIALQEYYRGLELLKGYALLNRKAFRKINKKYDKTVNARPSMRFINEKVNKAWFVQSEVLDGHIKVVEDLYARYFERGNHKVAAGKLRAKARKAGDFTASVFRNGLFLACGAVTGIEGTYYGTRLLRHGDPYVEGMTGFLLQVSCCIRGTSA